MLSYASGTRSTLGDNRDAAVTGSSRSCRPGRLLLRATTLEHRRLTRPDRIQTLRAAAPNRKPLQLALKRAMDVMGAGVGLLVLSPVLASRRCSSSCSTAARCCSSRIAPGIDGRPFRIVKFRTMRVGADAERAMLRSQNEVAGGASFKLTNDPRITRTGRWLRRTSIDELPQLWNVLAGHMSLVGPRPHPFDDVAGYSDWHFRRLSVKPGLTGLWQISARSNPDFDTWVNLDLEYIDSWSLALDLRIIAGTIPALIRSDGR